MSRTCPAGCNNGKVKLKCKVCTEYGNGQIRCPHCHGSQNEPGTTNPCTVCAGTGRVKCTNSDCDHGTVTETCPRCHGAGTVDD